MSGKPDRPLDERVLLMLFSIAFIEIRAAYEEHDDETARRKVGAVADLFHNAPGSLAHGNSATDEIDTVRERAKRSGLETYFASLEAHCLKEVEA